MGRFQSRSDDLSQSDKPLLRIELLNGGEVKKKKEKRNRSRVAVITVNYPSGAIQCALSESSSSTDAAALPFSRLGIGRFIYHLHVSL